MKRHAILSAAMLVALSACGGGKSSSNQMQQSKPASQPAAQPAQPAAQTAQAAPAAASARMKTPDWFDYDKSAKTLKLTVTAGLTSAKNYWNFNGGHDGDMIITVPVGTKVTLDFKDADPNMAHSLGIVDKVGGYSATPTLPAVFPGAITKQHGPATGVQPKKSETLHFTASKAGKYGMICYMAGHAATGMWIRFNVSSNGEAGVQTAGS